MRLWKKKPKSELATISLGSELAHSHIPGKFRVIEFTYNSAADELKFVCVGEPRFAEKYQTEDF